MAVDFKHRKTKTGNDYFPTYHALTKLLMDNIKLDPDKTILEPCAGSGDISIIINQCFENSIYSMDIEPRNKNIIQKDFLKYKKKFDYIITNPPYNIFKQFYEHSLKVFTNGMYLLLPLDYLHSKERFELMYNSDKILKKVFIFVRRPLFNKKYKSSGLMPTGALTFAWFYFEKNYIGKTSIEWLDNSMYMGVPTPADQLEFKDIR